MSKLSYNGYVEETHFSSRILYLFFIKKQTKTKTKLKQNKNKQKRKTTNKKSKQI